MLLTVLLLVTAMVLRKCCLMPQAHGQSGALGDLEYVAWSKWSLFAVVRVL